MTCNCNPGASYNTGLQLSVACRATKGGFIETRVRRKATWLLRYRRMHQLHQAADCHDGDDDGDDDADCDEGDDDGYDGGNDLQSADHQGADCDDGEGGR